MKYTGEMAGKTCPEAQKTAAGLVSESTGGCSENAANRMNYNFIVSGRVLL